MFVVPLKIIATVLMTLVCLVMAYAMYIYTAHTSEDEDENTQISPGITFAFFLAAFTQVLGIILIWGF